MACVGCVISMETKKQKTTKKKVFVLHRDTHNLYPSYCSGSLTNALNYKKFLKTYFLTKFLFY